MHPLPIDTPNERSRIERYRIAVAAFLLRLLVDFVSLPRTLWPISHGFKTRIDTDRTGSCRVCVYTPTQGGAPTGVVVHFHGGGWTISRPEAEGPLCRFLADNLRAVVVAPDYHKAPNYPYPHALEQGYAVLSWVASGGLSSHFPPHLAPSHTQIALTGGSSGSNLAAALTLLSLTRPLPSNTHIASLNLLYPALNLSVPYAEKLARVDPNRVLPPALSRLFLLSYLPPPRTTSDPFVSPALAPRDLLARFPPTLILTAAYDYLAHEAEEFATVLEEEGVQVMHRRFAKVGHAFDGMPVRNKKQRKLNEGARDEAWGMIAEGIRGVWKKDAKEGGTQSEEMGDGIGA